MICAHEWHAQELNHVQKHPHGYVGPDRDVPAVAKLQLFLAVAVSGRQIVQAASPPRYYLAVGPEQVLYEEEVQRGDDERGEEEVDEDEDEGDLEDGGERCGVGEAPGERCE